MLATATARLRSHAANITVRLLIDPGSELTFVSENIAAQLKSQRQHSTVTIMGIGGGKATQTKGKIFLNLHSNNNNSSVLVEAHVLNKVTSILPSFKLQNLHWQHLNNLQLADPQYLTPREINIIIGADNYGKIILPNIIKAADTMPMAQNSIFGWLILGPVNTANISTANAYHGVTNHSDDALQQLLTKFWVQEELPTNITEDLTTEERECEKHFQLTHQRDSSGRYTVRLPLKLPSEQLGSSYKAAHHALQRTIKRLSTDSDYCKLYHDFMHEYESLNHMVKASNITDVESTKYYLPHHGVLRPDKATTKLRVVFNGSCATSSGLSVNDIMHTGPNLLLEIFDVLIWLRHHRHLFATDITKMYRQVNVHKDDWNLQRILWVDQHNTEIPYCLTTVTYGTKAAPYLATRALLQLTEDEGHRFPLAVPSIQQGRYVDDIFGGADTTNQLIKIAKDLIGLCESGCFPLAKWHSSNTELLAEVSPQDDLNNAIQLDDCDTKILGLNWHPQTDNFTFVSKLQLTTGKVSKRTILSEIAQIFDPLGFISPVVIKAKMLLQELWLHKLHWDDQLPPQLTERWLSIREELKDLAKLTVPRWLNTWSTSKIELHGFSDASQFAMAAVVYITVTSESTGCLSAIVCSKTKVAPLKKLTIPRLELTAAVLLTKLVARVQKLINLDISRISLWTDSTVTLSWIKAHPSRWKEYVRNRVCIIQELLPTAVWRHVPGTSNPADCASRGISPNQLRNHHLWWSGPPWLIQDEDQWPKQKLITDASCEIEARPGVSLLAATTTLEYHWNLIERINTLYKLFRLTAICFRILNRLKLLPNSSPVTCVPSTDILRAKKFWIKATQELYFAAELRMLRKHSPLPSHHNFCRLTAFLDGEGIIRVGGRLKHSALTEEAKHPVIIPRDSRLTTLIIADAHLKTLHGGTQLTLAYTRQQYWIVGGRAAVKSHILRCVECARQRGIRAHQLMGQLPLSRVTPSRAFTVIGIDYAGPLTIKTWKGRGAKTDKGWICVFVCFTTSAVHLEAVTGCSTDTFLAAFKRFSSRRGLPTTVYSDCGTNFIGANAELKKLFVQYSKEHKNLATHLATQNIDWHFNPPASPHMGGKWEATVKSVKFHLRRTVGETLLTFEELATLLSQIEAVLNTRPLEPLTDDPTDVSALTPAHFLTGSTINSVPEPSLEDLALTKLSRWQLIQRKVQEFWAQWSMHYLQYLQTISKWQHPCHDIKIGSLVLLTDERLPPSKWPLARVLELHPGQDGLTRVVTIQTASTTLKRPIAKLCILPIHTDSSA